MSLKERLQSAYAQITNRAHSEVSVLGGFGTITREHEIYKAVVPNFLYKPPFGFPLSKNVPEIRRMGKTPFIEMVDSTIVNEVASLSWEIKADDGEGVPDSILKLTEEWFYNPNSNDESLDQVLKPFIRDILELESGVLEKVWNLKGEFVEMYARDGGTFTKNPNIHGVLPPSYLNKEDNGEVVDVPINDRYAYYQYGWLTGSRPIPFDRREIVYAIANPRADSIYGTSKVEILLDVLQLLTYGIDSNLEYFSDNNIPKGALIMEGASKEDITAFGKMWQEHLRKKDPSGKWRKYFHKMPVMNKKGEFVRVAFSNLELDLIAQQKWFTKIVWAVFGITASELGFTEDSNRATEVVQSNVFKRKAIAPLVSLIEYQFNTNIINDLPWIRGTAYEGKVKFEFDKFDLQEELAKTELYEREIKAGIKTRNEIREEKNLEKKEGGDELSGTGSMSPFGQMMPGKNGFMNTDKESPAMGTKKPLKGAQEGKSFGLADKMEIGLFEEITSEKIFKEAKKEIDTIKSHIKTLLRKEAGKHTLTQIKALDISFTQKIAEFFNLKNYKELVLEAVRRGVFEGSETVARKIGRNFVPNYKAVEFLQEHTFENMTNMEDEVKAKLRAELQRGLINREELPALAKRVDKVIDATSARANMIARTEINRAKNFGELDAWRQSGKPVLKEWYNPSPEAPVCKYLAGKIAGINDKFTYQGDEFDAPPAHPNCRSLLKFHTGDKDESSN